MASYKKLLTGSVLIMLLGLLFPTLYASAADGGYYYQIKVYHVKDKSQGLLVEEYLKDSYVPLLHRSGIKNVGVFKTLESDTADRRIYVFIPFKSLNEMESFDKKIWESGDLAPGSSHYNDAAYNTPPYTRIETIILNAFFKMPAPAVPKLTADKAERVYELRSYESATEKYYYNKVQMFNDGDEVGLFKRLGFNAVFYARVIAGSRMPNLMYMTTFNSKQDRDKHWDAFSNDAYWKSLSSKPEYQNNVSKADIIFLHPTAYSDF
jgi:hypothetical protein